MRSFRSFAIRGAVAALSAAVISACVAALPAMAADAQDSRLTWPVHVTLAARWLDPGETEAAITPFLVLYARHDALVKPMPGGGMTASLAEARTRT